MHAAGKPSLLYIHESTSVFRFFEQRLKLELHFLVAQAFEQGLLLNSPRPDTLRFMPALNVTKLEIDAMIDGLDAILTKMGAARRVA